jgi:hypothetical protein
MQLTLLFSKNIFFMHGEKAERNNNIQFKEWWGKRPHSGLPISLRSKAMKFWKRVVHKIERKQGQKQCHDV